MQARRDAMVAKAVAWSKDKKCHACGVGLPYNKRYNKYCSQDCYDANRPKSASKRKISEFCAMCGKDRPPRNVTCSVDCWNKFEFLDRVSKIVESGRMGEWAQNPYAQKRVLGHLKGLSCWICGITTWREKPAPLVLDHIDGNSSNDRLDNLRLVCGNCNMQLETFAGRNKGSGRHYRRVRYREGKSS